MPVLAVRTVAFGFGGVVLFGVVSLLRDDPQWGVVAVVALLLIGFAGGLLARHWLEVVALAAGGLLGVLVSGMIQLGQPGGPASYSAILIDAVGVGIITPVVAGGAGAVRRLVRSRGAGGAARLIARTALAAVVVATGAAIMIREAPGLAAVVGAFLATAVLVAIGRVIGLALAGPLIGLGSVAAARLSDWLGPAALSLVIVLVPLGYVAGNVAQRSWGHTVVDSVLFIGTVLTGYVVGLPAAVQVISGLLGPPPEETGPRRLFFVAFLAPFGFFLIYPLAAKFVVDALLPVP